MSHCWVANEILFNYSYNQFNKTAWSSRYKGHLDCHTRFKGTFHLRADWYTLSLYRYFVHTMVAYKRQLILAPWRWSFRVFFLCVCFQAFNQDLSEAYTKMTLLGERYETRNALWSEEGAWGHGKPHISSVHGHFFSFLCFVWAKTKV